MGLSISSGNLSPQNKNLKDRNLQTIPTFHQTRLLHALMEYKRPWSLNSLGKGNLPKSDRGVHGYLYYISTGLAKFAIYSFIPEFS